MWDITKILPTLSFTFGAYTIDTEKSVITFTYHVEFTHGITKTFTDQLFFNDIEPELWKSVPQEVLEPTLQALLIMFGINYWAVFRTKNIRIKGFTLTREQAHFWDTLYLNGLGEFFYSNRIDFRNLIAFPYDDAKATPQPINFKRPERALLLNGAGKDSILSAELLKESGTPFDYFAFASTPAHERIAKLVGAKTRSVSRRRDPLLLISGAYPSVSTFTFVAVLLAELLGYNSIIFSNERGADFGNLDYLGLKINHQWCKSSEAEKLINGYIQSYITPSISTRSLLRKYNELEIVQRFVQYPEYLREFTSCNTYFWEPRCIQRLSQHSYWCKRCAKCIFLFACFSAFLSKKDMVDIFGGNLFTTKRLLPHFKRILGIEGFKPFDCVGEPEEMILAMHYADQKNEYADTAAMKLFKKYFPPTYPFDQLEQQFFPGGRSTEHSLVVEQVVPEKNHE